MKLPPAWKVRRELRRLKEQASDLLFPRFIDRLRQVWYDLVLSRNVSEVAGQLPLTDRVAVFVVFQPRGIALSTLLTLEHLADEGWSVLIVSNHALSDADRTRLAAQCGHIVERPNSGYDFGAYREGWRWLARHNHALDRLILMNDSTWFPLRRNDDSLQRMEALDVDLAGHIYKTEAEKDSSLDHVESHLLMLGPRALRHPAIIDFWAKYVMSSDRRRTIDFGEKGIAQAAMTAGLSVQGLLGREKMTDLLGKLSDADLADALRALALHDPSTRPLRDAWLEAAKMGKPWRNEFLAWVMKELSNSRQHLLSVTFIDPAVSYGGMGFLKKSAERRFQLARMALMRGIEAGRIAPIDPVVAMEVQAAIQTWKPPFDWRSKPGVIQTAEL